VNLLSCRKIEEEARENSRFRALSNKFSDTTPSPYKKLKIKLRLLEFCSTYNYETTWKQTRKIGNTTLFSKTVRYQSWRARQDSCTLIYTGKLGSGKSVLLANIVDDLNVYVQDKNFTVAYFFCRHDIAQSLKAGTILGSLVRQLLHPIPDLSMAEKFLDKTTAQLDFDKLFLYLGGEQVFPTNFKAYFILDGIDECDGSEREELIMQLQKFQQIFPLLLCLSTRLGLDDN
jgi:Cdc6-like AAA superfamily ATPase